MLVFVQRDGTVVESHTRPSWRVSLKEPRSEGHTSELQSLRHLVCRLLLEKKKSNPADRCRDIAILLVLRKATLTRRRKTRHQFVTKTRPIWSILLIFFFNDAATTEIYSLSLHDALPI